MGSIMCVQFFLKPLSGQPFVLVSVPFPTMVFNFLNKRQNINSWYRNILEGSLDKQFAKNYGGFRKIRNYLDNLQFKYWMVIVYKTVVVSYYYEIDILHFLVPKQHKSSKFLYRCILLSIHSISKLHQLNFRNIEI